MLEFRVDRRDVNFVLFEQFDLEGLTQWEPYRELARDDFESILDAFQKFVKEVLAPIKSEADKAGCTFVDGRVRVPDVYRAAYEQFCEGGWIAVTRPTDLGGMGLPLPLGLMISELGIGAASSFFFFPGLTVAAGHLLENHASPELTQLFVPRLYAGRWTGTMCLTEPQAGSSVGDLSTTATPVDGSDSLYAIKGNKIFISAGDHDLCENIVHLVLARVPGDPAGTKGISLFAVPKFRVDAKGNLGDLNDVKVTALEAKMGIHGSPTCSLSFGDEDACHGYLIGERSRGITYMFQMMNEARIICGVQGAGAANASYLAALAYAKERIQGAKVTERSPDAPSVAIIEHPDVRRNLMLAKSISEGIRALLVQTAFYAEAAINHPDPEERRRHEALVDLLTPICKAYATDQGFRVTEIAIQIHGGYGYIKEFGVEQMMRDVKIASIYEGTNGIQALDLLGRKMRLNDGALFMTWMQAATEWVSARAGVESIADLVRAVDAAKNALGEVAMNFMAQAKLDPELPLLGATPFLEMFGHVEVARLLVDQAAVAAERLDALAAEKGVGADGIAQLVRAHEVARFYDAKIKTARFFVCAQLPHAQALAESIKSGDRSALDIHFGAAE